MSSILDERDADAVWRLYWESRARKMMLRELRFRGWRELADVAHAQMMEAAGLARETGTSLDPAPLEVAVAIRGRMYIVDVRDRSKR